MLPIKMMWLFLTIPTIFATNLNKNLFPNDFLFGTATSAYQVEGAHNVNGKGPNLWDYNIAKNPIAIVDRSNGNIACDSYNKFKEDVQILKELGVDFYRFSISWSRILPTGYPNKINPDGIRYYNDLINELLKYQIQPVVTIYHFDLPQNLTQLGGLTNPNIVPFYLDYARIVFENFGNRVKYWITINSPCFGYGDGGDVLPKIIQSGISNYLCYKSALLLHAKTYRLYQKQFRQLLKGKIGITIDLLWFEPFSKSKENLEAAERAQQFLVGCYTNPILSKNGDFPEIVKQRVANVSKKENFAKSRLPKLTPKQIKLIRGSTDFLGVNAYTSWTAKNIEEINSRDISLMKDMRIEVNQSKDWPSSNLHWLKVTPWGLRKALKWLKVNYGDFDIFITENGFSDNGQIRDYDRINYHQLYLSAVLDAIYEDKVNVRAYSVWSLMDNFEWMSGYSKKFGLYHVDFKDSNRSRTPKESAKWYKKVLQQRKLMIVD